MNIEIVHKLLDEVRHLCAEKSLKTKEYLDELKEKDKGSFVQSLFVWIL